MLTCYSFKITCSKVAFSIPICFNTISHNTINLYKNGNIKTSNQTSSPTAKFWKRNLNLGNELPEPKLKKVGVLPIRIVKSNVSSVGQLHQRETGRRAYAQNVRLYYHIGSTLTFLYFDLDLVLLHYPCTSKLSPYFYIIIVLLNYPRTSKQTIDEVKLTLFLEVLFQKFTSLNDP